MTLLQIDHEQPFAIVALALAHHHRSGAHGEPVKNLHHHCDF
jgi:hypothetical protein